MKAKDGDTMMKLHGTNITSTYHGICFLVAVIKIFLSSLHAPTAHSLKGTSSLETLWSFAVRVVYQGKVL